MSVAMKVFFLPMGSVLIRQHKSVRGNPSARPIPDRKILFVSGAVVVWDKRSEGSWSSSQLKPRRFDAWRKQSPTPSVDLRLGGQVANNRRTSGYACLCTCSCLPATLFFIYLWLHFFFSLLDTPYHCGKALVVLWPWRLWYWQKLLQGFLWGTFLSEEGPHWFSDPSLEGIRSWCTIPWTQRTQGLVDILGWASFWTTKRQHWRQNSRNQTELLWY